MSPKSNKQVQCTHVCRPPSREGSALADSEDSATQHRCGGCPKTGETVRQHRRYWWLKWTIPVVGLVSFVWFLVRVIPKPSRATYPCQRVAMPLASGFVIWLAGLAGSVLAYRRAKVLFQRSRYILAGALLVSAVLAIWLALSTTSDRGAAAAFTPSDPPNTPMGIAKGIFPGRVVWAHEPDVAKWDGATGSWWDDNNTDQATVNYMVSQSLRCLTGQSSDAGAWDALFRYFNKAKGLGDLGYQKGEKVTIKINMNQDNGQTWGPGSGMPSPHFIHSLLDQLIKTVGVPGSAITIYDGARYIGDPIYNKVRSNPDPNFQAVRFEVTPARASGGRFPVVADTANPIYFASPSVPGGARAYIPQCVTQARYLINVALFRQHTMFAVTACAKNHFGSVNFPQNGGWTPEPLHNTGRRDNAMGSYNCLVDLIGHPHLGGKTLLYLVDGIYGATNQSSSVMRYTSFGEDWTSCMFASQDPLAIDSVALDFLNSEPKCTEVRGSVDNHLHEAALANNPPSGAFYDPDGDKIRLQSLGVHEHWNNPSQKKYSRNLGTGAGIELVVPPITSPDGPVENVTKGTRYNYIRYAIKDAAPGDEILVHPGTYRESIDFAGKNLTMRSLDPNSLQVVAATIIEGTNQAAVFSGGENPTCVLAGFTLTSSNTGVYCSAASPTIRNCRIIQNKGPGIQLSNESNPTIVNCLIAANTGHGIDMTPLRTGRFVKYNRATIDHCTIVENGQHGIFDSIPTITNSIIYSNGLKAGLPQINCYQPVITYSDVQGGWPGTGNIDADPCLAGPDDYHLLWNSPCINAGDPNYTSGPGRTDIDGEPRVLTGRTDIGFDEVGEKQADLTRDGRIDSRDLYPFAQAWLCIAADESWNAQCDLQQNGRIDLTDWASLATDWLWHADWHKP